MNWNDPITIFFANLFISAIVGYGVASFRIGKYTEKVDQLEKCDLNQRLSTLEGEFKTSHGMLAAKFIQAKSPLMLTDDGNKLLNDSGAKTFIDSEKTELIKTIKTKNPTSAYDVQEFSKSVIADKSSDESFKPIKDYLYSHGLSLDLIIGVMAIYLRDFALPALGFNVSDLDKPKANGKNTVQ